MAASEEEAAAPSALARPKSSTLTVPSGRSLMFAGLEIAVDDAVLVCRLERALRSAAQWQ